MADKTITFTSTGFPQGTIAIRRIIPYFPSAASVSSSVSNRDGQVKSLSLNTCFRRGSGYISGTAVTLVFFKNFKDSTGWDYNGDKDLRLTTNEAYEVSPSTYLQVVDKDSIIGEYSVVPNFPGDGNREQTFTINDSSILETIGAWFPDSSKGENLFFCVLTTDGEVYFGRTSDQNGLTHTLSLTYEDTSPSTFTLSSTKDLKDKDILTATISQQNTQCNHTLSFYKKGDGSPFSTWSISTGENSISKTLSLINDGVFNGDASGSTADGYIILSTYLKGTKIGENSINVSYLCTVDEESLNPTCIMTVSPLNGSPTVSTSTWVIKITNVLASGTGNNKATITSWSLTLDSAPVESGTSTPSSSIKQTKVLSEGTHTWALTLTNSFDRTKTITYSLFVAKDASSNYISHKNIRCYRVDSSGAVKAEGLYFKIEGQIESATPLRKITLTYGGRTLTTSFASDTNIYTYSLSDFIYNSNNYFYTYNSDYKTSIEVAIKTWNSNGATGANDKEANWYSYSTHTVIPSSQYLLFFKKNGLALGIGATVKEDNLLNIGWPTHVDVSNVTPLTLINNSGGDVTIDFRGYIWNNKVYPLFRVGCEGTGGDNNRSFYVDLYSPTASANKDTDVKQGEAISFLKSGHMSFNGATWSILEPNSGDGTNQFWINVHSGGINRTTDVMLKTDNTYIFKQKGQDNDDHDVLRRMDFALFNSQTDTPVTGLWIRDTNTARLFLQPKNANTSIIGEVLIDSNSTDANKAGLRFRNSSITNYGGLYDEYVFPPRAAGSTSADTYTIYALKKNVFYSTNKPTGDNIPEGSIWLQPV